MKARGTTIFDDFRHQQFPDDFLIYFLKEGVRQEAIWCRVEDEIDGLPAVTLLDNPYYDFGVKQGELIRFGWFEDKEKWWQLQIWDNR
ncbi:MAG: hypothetical protein O0V67_07940 [Methanocorpusculum sp.]|nr:hypothetical protein [Methanocorpusculum sp.]